MTAVNNLKWLYSFGVNLSYIEKKSNQFLNLLPYLDEY